MTTTRTRAELVAEYKTLARSLGRSELMSDSDVAAVTRKLSMIQAEIDALDAAAKEES